jgi:hypothetical protein
MKIKLNKNKFTNFLGLLVAISGAICGISTQVKLPEWLITGCVIVSAVSVALIGWASGKAKDLTKKPE